MGSPNRARPILVTGVPRSGTTWLARLLASSPGTCMPGREPMNPRGRQFALGGQLDSWVRRTTFSEGEVKVLRRCYTGREPRMFSRYGIRQWAAPLSSSRIVMKDPFALLSLAAIADVSRAIPVVLYRHPAAVLGSYRRMGWTADTAELVSLGAPAPQRDGDLDAMAAMWKWCHQVVLDDLDRLSNAVIISHHALTVGGAGAHAALCERLGLTMPLAREVDPAPSVVADDPPVRRDGVLHDFARTSTDVATSWRQYVDPGEIDEMERAVGDVWRALEGRQLALPVPELDKNEDLW